MCTCWLLVLGPALLVTVGSATATARGLTADVGASGFASELRCLTHGAGALSADVVRQHDMAISLPAVAATERRRSHAGTRRTGAACPREPCAGDFCVQTRGGATMQGPGSEDYLSTLRDQSKPWWQEDKKTHLIRPAAAPKGGEGFFGASKLGSLSSRQAAAPPKKRPGASPSSVTHGLPDLGGGGWLALAALPAAMLRGKLSSAESKQDAKLGLSSRPQATKKAKPTNVKKAKPKKQRATPAITASTATASKPRSFVQAHRSSSAVGRGGGTSSSFRFALVPGDPYLRALGVTVIAALGSGGLYKLQTKNLLRSAWPISFLDPWQVLTAVAWAVNMKATFVGGRLDGSSQARSESSRSVGFFTPAGWAFVIWAPIFLGEMLFVLFQLLPLPSIRGSWWLSDISPWFAAAMLCQTLWCSSFRPWARDARLLWLPALLLGGVAAALGGAHGILREAWFERDIELPQYLVAHLPLSLHFGWISCASLVNLNGFFASAASLSNRVKLVLSVCTVLVAVVLGVGITLKSEDAVYAAVVAWALWAVGSEGGWRNLKGRVHPGAIRVQEVAAKTGSVLALLAAGLPVALSLKDLVGGREGSYNEDY